MQRFKTEYNAAVLDFNVVQFIPMNPQEKVGLTKKKAAAKLKVN